MTAKSPSLYNVTTREFWHGPRWYDWDSIIFDVQVMDSRPILYERGCQIDGNKSRHDCTAACSNPKEVWTNNSYTLYNCMVCVPLKRRSPPPTPPFLRRMKLLTSHRCTLSLPSLYTLAASLVRTHLVLQSLTLSTTALRSCSLDGQSLRRVLQITVTTIHISLPAQQKTRKRKHPIPHMPRSTDSHITNW